MTAASPGGGAAAALADEARALAPRRVVLLGEASHGTSEFYAWRARLTLRLVRDHGFHFVAVEGDWPDCARLDAYVRGTAEEGSAREVLRAFDRWPTWMWVNEEVADLAEALRSLNLSRARGDRAGFHGLDVYSLWDSLRAVRAYLERAAPEALPQAERAYRCFEPFGWDEQAYAASTALVPSACEEEVVRLLARLRQVPPPPLDGEAAFSAEQNALVAVGAERYYRAMVRADADSWNVRDTHMADTLQRLLDFHGPGAKGVVWAHNTHIGDARATDMARAGMVNLGQLARERWGPDQVALVGFGTYRGAVLAAPRWGAPVERMPVPPARAGSVEELLHRALGADVWMPLGGLDDLARLQARPMDQGARRGWRAPLGHRAIGVVYRPAAERFGNYVPTVLPLRYDHFVHLDETRPLRPLRTPLQEEPDPAPFPLGV